MSAQAWRVEKENSASIFQERPFVTADQDSLTKRAHAEEVIFRKI